MIWLMVGMLMCRLFVGCSRESEENFTEKQGAKTETLAIEAGLSEAEIVRETLEQMDRGDKEEPEESEQGIDESESESHEQEPERAEESEVVIDEPESDGHEQKSARAEESEVVIDEPKSKDHEQAQERAEESEVVIDEPKSEGHEQKPEKAKERETVLQEEMPPKEAEGTIEPQATKEPEVVFHEHTIVVQEIPADCLETGVKREYCEGCKEVLQETTVAALGHAFTKSVWELPTCQKGGYYNNVCARCGLVECVTQEPLAHQTEDIIVQEGNCMEDTIIQHICKECGIQVRGETRYTPYDVHMWTTMEADGTEITYCERCGVAK